MSDHTHFEGQSALDHLKTARSKGQFAQAEIHGMEPSGFSVAFISSLRDVAIYFTLTVLFLSAFGMSTDTYLPFIALFFGLVFWQTSRASFLGWSRLSRLHRLIEEERYEIEHHREQEREELIAMYQAKGFEGKQLDSIITVLMADDNRLLNIMLEEELGLKLERFEHPLKQGLGALLGSIVSFVLIFLCYYFFSLLGAFVFTSICLLVCGALHAKLLNNDRIQGSVWSLGIGFISLASAYFLLKFFKL